MTSTDNLPDLSRPTHCVAVKSQLTYVAWEDHLHTLARKGHPTCAWWWGLRVAGPGSVAYCYVCDSKITSFARNFPMTVKAKRAVEKHRNTHRALTIPSLLNAK